MKKSLIALAVAGAFAAPAFAATSNVDVYGIVSYSVDYIDTNNAAGNGSDLVTGVDNVSRIGFKGSEDLGGGMKANFQIETDLTGFTNRNTWVGLSGGFGEVRMGRHDTPYKMSTGSLDPFADTIADYNTIIGDVNGTDRFDTRAGATVAYISPNMSGLTAAVAYIQTKNVEAAGADEQKAWSLAAMYSNGPLFASAAYETYQGAAGGGSSATAGDDTSAWKLGVGYTMDALKVGLVYETIENGLPKATSATDVDRDAWYLSLAYNMGATTLKAAYGTAEDVYNTASSGANFWAVGMDYAFSKRTNLYAVYGTVGNDTNATYGLRNYAAAAAGKDVDGFSVGIKHSF